MNEIPGVAEQGLAMTAGQLLKAARERQGIHISVLAASLKVTRRKLELLEADLHEELPDATFVRALAMGVCRNLKVDAGPVLERLPQSPIRMLDPSQGLNRPFRSQERHRWRESSDWRRFVSWPLLAAVALVGAGLLLYFAPLDVAQLGLSGGDKPGGVAAVPAPADGAMSPPVQVEAADAPSSSAFSAASAAVTATPALPAGSAGSAIIDGASAPASATTSAGLLGLAATDTSWVEVRDGEGQVLLARHLRPGELLSLDGALPLRITAGNAAATQITFRGQPVALAASTRDNVARLELK